MAGIGLTRVCLANGLIRFCCKGSLGSRLHLAGFVSWWPTVSRRSLFSVCAVIGGMLASTCGGQAETIVLKSGNRVQGEILKDSAEALVLDLGFDVIKVPKEAVSSIEEETVESDEVVEPGGPQGEGVMAVEGRLYALAENPATRSVKENAERLGEAVVQIRTPSGLGSGFVIHPKGYVITNNHVISGEHRLTVILFQRRERTLEKVQRQKVKIVATSPLMDLALLKIETEESDADFAYAPLGASHDVRSGQPVFAIGSPLGLGRSVSQGIVSVRNRVVPGGLIYLQHTAQINPGNSGGPLFNLQGEVVGALNMKMASVGVEGMGFAIPASVLKLFLENQDAYAFDPRHPNAGFRYLDPPSATAGDEESDGGESVPSGPTLESVTDS